MLMRVFFILLTTFSLAFGSFFPRDGSLIENRGELTIQASSNDFTVEFFPVAPYHVGDLISVRITYTGSADIEGIKIRITLPEHPGAVNGETGFSGYSEQAVFYWVMDTHEIEPGFLKFNFEIPTAKISWQEGINLLPNPGNRSHQWATEQMDCCTIHYITGTDAEDDLTTIKQTLTEQTQKAWSYFKNLEGVNQSESQNPLTLVLVPVVVGHGGFATDKAVLTYSRSNWAGTNFEILTHHEVVHVIDRQLNDGPRPSMLAEGLAVYLSGGHYQEGEPLARAAALQAMGMYLPILDIADDFYDAQHEIGYMEAAALVAYMVERWGWEEFIDFYFNLPEGRQESQIISDGLERKFGLDLTALEVDFLGDLQYHTPDESVLEDVRLTVEIYDMLRRYQSLVIPSAHFRTAWWPPVGQMMENGIVGDYAYREKSPFNVIIESLFLKIYAHLEAENTQAVEENLIEIEAILDSVEAYNRVHSHYRIDWRLPVAPFLPVKP